ncbi:MAG: MipA/OmpV family protein [Alphaproteobacteria bacterium]|nr:MAG: MipA/OmpV family protein [Alphaproteobacteria bacterium]
MRLPLILGAALVSTPGLAQPAQPTAAPPGRPATDQGWSVTVGVAPVVSPAWQGSKDYVLSVFPDLRVNYGDSLFASIPDGIGWNAVNSNGLKIGPIAKLRFGRDEDGSGSPFAVTGGSDALIGLGDIDAAVEVGGFVEQRFGPRQRWRGRVEVRRGFGGHEGTVGDVSLSYQARAGRTIVNFGPRATVASEGYTRTYFGIDAAQSLGSGLAPYQPKGGLVSYGLGGSLIHPLDQRSAITAFSSLERLGGVAKDSPLVLERGQATQFTVGVGYGYRF